MWCASLSYNDLIGLGRVKDFLINKLGHAISAKFDVAHGASLSAVCGIEKEDVKQAAEDVYQIFCMVNR